MKLLREYYELCEGGVCQDLLTEDEKRFVANGGFETLEAALGARDVQVGRAIVNHPCAFSRVDAAFYGEGESGRTRGDVLDAYIEYVADAAPAAENDRRRALAPAYHLFAGEPRNAKYQRTIKKLAGTKLASTSAATILRAARTEVAESLARPLADFAPLGALPVYERESPKSGPLQRLVR